MVVLAPRPLSNNLVIQLNTFLSENNFPCLYKSYAWNRDTYCKGFPDIFNLEVQFHKQLRGGGISSNDIRDVAKWGGFPSYNRISIKDIGKLNDLNDILTIGNKIAVGKSEHLAGLLDKSGKYVGPTYVSKVLRFAMPEQYGAIDTRCVRVFGQGDPSSQKHSWINLKVNDNVPRRWHILRTNWTTGYGVWIDILRYFAQRLPANCPHPAQFNKLGLRANGIWTCADIEIALFAYASKFVKQLRPINT